MVKLLNFSISQLINASVYVGVWKRAWHRSMNQFIVGWRFNFSILNMDYIWMNLKFCLKIFSNVIKNNGLVVIFINKLSINLLSKSLTKFLGLHIWNNKWESGFLTNYKEIKKYQNKKIFKFPNYVINLSDNNAISINRECLNLSVWYSSLCNSNDNLFGYNGLPIIANNLNKKSIYFFLSIFLKKYLRGHLIRKYLYFKKFFYFRKKFKLKK